MRTALAALVASALALGCSKASPDSTTSSPPSTNAAAAPQAKAPEEHGAQAPLRVELASETGLPAGEHGARILLRAPASLPYPVTMNVSLPRGASLAQGSLEETLTVREHEERTIRWKSDAAPSLDSPLRVVVKGGDASMGLRAERQLPARPELHVPFRPEAAPPGGRPRGAVKP